MRRAKRHRIDPHGGEIERRRYEASKIIVETPSKNYTADMITELLVDVGVSSRVPVYNQMRADPDMKNSASPGVDTFVAYVIMI